MEDSPRPKKLRRLDNGDVALNQTANGDGIAQSNSELTTSTETNDTIIEAAEETVTAQSDETIHKRVGVQKQSYTDPDTGLPISKNQLKKKRRQAEWDAGREDRKLLRKEKVVEKRERKKAAREAAEADPSLAPPPAAPKTIHRPVTLPVTLLIDCNFDELMGDRERVSLGAQITRSYAENRRSPAQVDIVVCSWSGKLKKRFEGVLANMHHQWHGVQFLTQDFVQASVLCQAGMRPPTRRPIIGPFERYTEAFDGDCSELKAQGEVVYLTSDAEETLTELKPFSTYVIGGLVDRNREKGLCYRRATEAGVRTAKLPIGTYLEMSSRKVLATNHVVEIMLKYLEVGDWGAAFISIIPKRKGGKLKDQDNGDEPEEEVSSETGAEVT